MRGGGETSSLRGRVWRLAHVIVSAQIQTPMRETGRALFECSRAPPRCRANILERRPSPPARRLPVPQNIAADSVVSVSSLDIFLKSSWPSAHDDKNVRVFSRRPPSPDQSPADRRDPRDIRASSCWVD